MKSFKYLLVAAALFAASAAQAQLRLGVKGGVNFSKAKFEKKMFNSDNITGFQVGPTLEFMFNKQWGMGFDASVLYSQKGFGSESETARNAYLDVPVNLKWKFGIPKINPYVAAGPYINFRIAGENIWKVKENSEGVKDQIKAKDFGAGLNFGAGVELLDFLQVGFNYCWGLTDNYETFDASDVDSYKGKERTLSVVATIFF